jgi:hypothetical protein
MGFTMRGWHSTFLGMRELPRDIGDFEMKVFFTFDDAEREAINARRGDAHKLGLARQEQSVFTQWIASASIVPTTPMSPEPLKGHAHFGRGETQQAVFTHSGVFSVC